MTKAKAKTSDRPALSDWQTQLSEELSRQEDRNRAAMNLLLIQADGNELSSEEIAFVRAVGVTDEVRRREVNKLTRVLKLYSKSGTAKERKELAVRLAAMESQLQPVISKAEAEVARLQNEVAKARADLEAARLEADRRESAAASMTEDSLLPEFVRQQLSDIHKAQSACEASRIVRETETRLKMIAGVLKLSDVEAMKLHAQGQQIAGRDLFTTVGDRGQIVNPKVDALKWAAYVAELRAEVPVLEAEMAAADKELEVFRLEAQQLRAFYLSPEFESQLEQMEVSL